MSLIFVITMGKTEEEIVSGLLEAAIIATGSIPAPSGMDFKQGIAAVKVELAQRMDVNLDIEAKRAAVF